MLLTLIRHATAEDERLSQNDADRQLTPLGELQAKEIAQQLQLARNLPDKVLCSPAKRTLQTAQILCETLDLPSSFIHQDKRLYAHGISGILSSLVENTEQRIFIISHNPFISEFACELSKDKVQYQLPPAGVIGLSFSINSWKELLPHQAKLLFFIKPKKT